jgi:SAM-dependent methyltransferase
LRCLVCRSLYRDLTAADYAAIHAKAFSDMEFISMAVTFKADRPDYATWSEFADLLPPGPLLEIGPGAGYLLAAAREAGREVFGVESSEVHRKFIERTWGLPNVFPSMDDLPAATRFGAVILINTIEHVFDVGGLFAAVRARLAPEGRLLVSTCNAECILLPLVGPYWAMLKVSDHVSIPAAESFRRLANRTGFACRKVWTGELPLETPIGIAVAIRDWARERKGAVAVPDSPGPASNTEVDTRVPLSRQLARNVMRFAERVDPTRHVTARLGRAAAIRGLFARAE